jgi:hypothetical protein
VVPPGGLVVQRARDSPGRKYLGRSSANGGGQNCILRSSTGCKEHCLDLNAQRPCRELSGFEPGLASRNETYARRTMLTTALLSMAMSWQLTCH